MDKEYRPGVNTGWWPSGIRAERKGAWDGREWEQWAVTGVFALHLWWWNPWTQEWQREPVCMPSQQAALAEAERLEVLGALL